MTFNSQQIILAIHSIDSMKKWSTERKFSIVAN
uniref:Uncharacterized protein n=1 Tax=Rhizophora mucronata TaxID=61149 RepID=A0A2P2PWU0_RHIMU